MMSDVGVERTGHVALVEIRRPPNNFFDILLIKEPAIAFESFDEDANIRAIVLAAQGKAFCAGANFGDGSALDTQGRWRNGACRTSLAVSRCFRCAQCATAIST
jgi:enoyl-CoA hydratase/carnithine racemase